MSTRCFRVGAPSRRQRRLVPSSPAHFSPSAENDVWPGCLRHFLNARAAAPPGHMPVLIVFPLQSLFSHRAFNLFSQNGGVPEALPERPQQITLSAGSLLPHRFSSVFAKRRTCADVLHIRIFTVSKNPAERGESKLQSNFERGKPLPSFPTGKANSGFPFKSDRFLRSKNRAWSEN